MMRPFLLLLSLTTVACNGNVIGANRRNRVVEDCPIGEELVTLDVSFATNNDHVNSLGWTLSCDDETVWIVPAGTALVDEDSSFATYTKCIPLDINLCELTLRNDNNSNNGGLWPWYLLGWGPTTVAVSSEEESGDAAFLMERKYCFGAKCNTVPMEIVEDDEYANEEGVTKPRFGVAAITGTAVALILIAAAAAVLFSQYLKKKRMDPPETDLIKKVKPIDDSESINGSSYAESSTTTAESIEVELS